MFNIKDRIPTYPNRKKITFEDTGEEKYALIEYADEPTENGTFLNRSLFLEQFQSLKNHIEYITTSQTWTVPAGVTEVEVFLVNGGYDGTAGAATSTSTSSSTTGDYGGTGGAGGACCWLPSYSVTAGQTIDIVVGAANGGISSFAGTCLADTFFENSLPYHVYKDIAQGSAGGTGGYQDADGEFGALAIVNNIYSGFICPIDGKIYGVSGAGGGGNKAYRGTGASRYVLQNQPGGTAGKNTANFIPTGGTGKSDGRVGNNYGWWCGGGGASYDNDGGAGTTDAVAGSINTSTTNTGGNGGDATTFGCGGGGGGAVPAYGNYTVGVGGTGAQGVVIIAY